MSTSTPEFDYLRELVYRHAAIVLEPGQVYLMDSRLGDLAQQAGYGSAVQLLSKLRQEQFQVLHRKVVEAMTTNETSFFRDIHPFEALRNSVLPSLIRLRAFERRLTIWCAASSTGQEPYSLAMLLQENFPEMVRGWAVRIVATDLASQVLERARSGRFTQLEVNRGLPATMLARYFRQEGKEWCLTENIRKRVEFREMNLAKPWPLLPSMDLVMMRNVLIYFDLETKRDILRRTRELLRPGGCLFLGTAETTLNLDPKFVQRHAGRTTFFEVAPG